MNTQIQTPSASVKVEKRIEEDGNVYFIIETRNGALHLSVSELIEVAKGIKRANK